MADPVVKKLSKSAITIDEILNGFYQMREEIKTLKSEIDKRPRVTWMTQEEFDRITNDGQNLEPIMQYEDLRVYERGSVPPTPPTPQGGSVIDADGVLTLDGVIAADGTLTIEGVIDYEGVLTI